MIPKAPITEGGIVLDTENISFQEKVSELATESIDEVYQILKKFFAKS